jgi:hypothetical protein
MNKATFGVGIVLLVIALSMFARQTQTHTGISPEIAEIFLDLPLAILGFVLVALSLLAFRRHAQTLNRETK